MYKERLRAATTTTMDCLLESVATRSRSLYTCRNRLRHLRRLGLLALLLWLLAGRESLFPDLLVEALDVADVRAIGILASAHGGLVSVGTHDLAKLDLVLFHPEHGREGANHLLACGEHSAVSHSGSFWVVTKIRLLGVGLDSILAVVLELSHTWRQALNKVEDVLEGFWGVKDDVGVSVTVVTVTIHAHLPDVLVVKLV